MWLRNGAILILLCFLNSMELLGNEHRRLKQNPKSIHLEDNSKISLNIVPGNPAQILCDVSSLQREIKWIEWRRSNRSSPVLVKFANYQAYVDPDFSNRLSVDRHGHLLINPVLVEDYAIYKCTTYTIDNHIPMFAHGTSVELKISQSDINPESETIHRIRLGFPALVDCNIEISRPPKSPLAYTWTKNNIDVSLDTRFTILISGSMFIRNTMKDDAGIYMCVARTLSDSVSPKMYRGVAVNLDVLYPPAVVITKQTMIVPLGGDIYIPCTSEGNPSLISTQWLWNSSPLPQILQSIIFPNGTLHIKNAQTNYEGTFRCTPFNEVGFGKSAKTVLKVEDRINRSLPVFTLVPPKILTVKLGDNLAIVCKATGYQINWRKVNSTLSTFRSTPRGGNLLINNLQLEDSGIYECKANSITSSSSHFMELIVISTPIPPAITNVAISPTYAFISWRSGYNGGLRQTIEIWYRHTNSDDYHWRSITRISSHATSYTIDGIEPRLPYLFSLRGVNDAGFGLFSDIFYAGTVTLSSDDQEEDTKDKPLAPSDLRLNITEDSFIMSWSYLQIPGFPQAQFFIIEYRPLSSSLTWTAIGDPISWERRQCFIDNSMLNSNAVFVFRMFTFGGQFSEPSHVVEANMMSSAIATKSPSDSSFIIIVVYIISVFCFLALLLYIFCFDIKRNRKKKLTRVTKIERKHKFNLPYSSTDSDFSDSENDLCELNDVRLFPNVSPFVAERQENLSQAYLKKLGKTKYDHHSIKTGDEHVPRPATNSMHTSNSRYKKPSLRQDHYGQNPNSRELLPTAFKSGRLLPEYPELRDSYDQFCTTMSEHSSHEELEAKRSIKDLDMLNGGIEFAKSLDPSNCCSDEILDNVYLCKRRKKTTLEKDSDGAHANYQRWSMPEFTKPWYETSDSDTESTLTDQTNMKHHFLSAHQLTEASDKPVANSKHLSSSACYDINPTCGNGTEDEEIPAAKDLGFIKKGTVSCPGIVSAESHASLNATDIDYDSSGFCEESRVVSSCSSHCHVLTNTGSENGCYAYCHESYSEDDHAKDGCKILETNLSICEVTARASDSGYSGLSNGTRGSPECEEPDNYDTLRREHVDILYKPDIFETLKHPQETLETQSDSDRDKNDGISREGHLYNLQSDSNATEGKNSFYSTLPKLHLLPFPDAIITNQVSEGKKEKRRAKVIEEFRFNKTSLKPRTTRNSLYPTYEV